MERAQRLRKGTEFDTVYQKGTVTGGPLFVLRHLENGGEVTRWGFAVGKRLSKKATVRNRLKRQMREAARLLAVRPGVDIVVTARPGALEADFAAIESALGKALRRAGLLCEDEK
jgi:ribonuclease P protein component